MLVVIADGMILIASISSTRTADSYSGPIKLRMGPGTKSNITTIGAVRLRLILRLVEDKSLFKKNEEGMTIYAILEAKLDTTIVIIRAT
jgi:hypothetical protein